MNANEIKDLSSALYQPNLKGRLDVNFLLSPKLELRFFPQSSVHTKIIQGSRILYRKKYRLCEKESAEICFEE